MHVLAKQQHVACAVASRWRDHVGPQCAHVVVIEAAGVDLEAAGSVPAGSNFEPHVLVTIELFHPITLHADYEISAEDLREIRKAVDAAATADGSSYRLRRISEDLRRVLREVADQMQRGGRDLAESLDGGDK